ncbi:MAG: polymerase subunit tau, partial [Planctomycetota bacterium]
CSQLSLKPMMGKYRIAIVEDADYLNEESANAFLKTLEEPGPGSVLILIGSSPDHQLDTVVSRCQVVQFQPLSPDDIEAILLDSHLASQKAEARKLAEQSEGSLARALALADQDYQSARQLILHELIHSGVPTAPRIAKIMEDHVKNSGKEAALQRRRAVLILEDLSRFFRDVLWNGAGLSSPSGDVTWSESVRRLATSCEPEDVFILADRSMLAIGQIQSNGNMGLILSAWASDVCQTLQRAK